MVLKYNQWYRAVQSYLATISFVDAHVGRLLIALEHSAHADNTIVVLWGDHGWHLGEKQHWRKHALWETTTRTTLIISVPGQLQRNQLCWRPGSLIDLYPTLVELCGLPSRNGLDGQSIVPLLQNPKMEWKRKEKKEARLFGKGSKVLSPRPPPRARPTVSVSATDDRAWPGPKNLAIFPIFGDFLLRSY